MVAKRSASSTLLPAHADCNDDAGYCDACVVARAAIRAAELAARFPDAGPTIKELIAARGLTLTRTSERGRELARDGVVVFSGGASEIAEWLEATAPGARCYACDRAATGLRDRRHAAEGRLVAACGRHADRARAA